MTMKSSTVKPKTGSSASVSDDEVKMQIMNVLSKVAEPEVSDEEELWCMALVKPLLSMPADAHDYFKMVIQKQVYDFKHKGIMPSLPK